MLVSVMEWKVMGQGHRRGMYRQIEDLASHWRRLRQNVLSSFVIGTEADLATKSCVVLLVGERYSPSSSVPVVWRG